MEQKQLTHNFDEKIHTDVCVCVKLPEVGSVSVG